MERASEVIAQWICNNIPQEQPLAFFIGKETTAETAWRLRACCTTWGIPVPCTFCSISGNCRSSAATTSNGCRTACGCRAWIGWKLPRMRWRSTLCSVRASAAGSRSLFAARSPFVNGLGCRVISIDLPSGMLSEYGNAGREIVYADVTLTLEFPKLALLLSEAGEAAGEIVILPIELDENYKRQARSPYYYADGRYVSELVLPCSRFAHKGTYGHAFAGLRLAGHDGGCRIGDRGRAAFRMRVGDGACSCRRTVRSAYVLPVGAGQRRSDVRVLPVAGRYDEVRRRRDRQRGGEARLVRAGFRGVVVVRDADGDRCRCVEYVGGPSRIGRVDASGMRTDSPFGRIAPLGRNVERRSRPNRKR